VNCFIGIGQEVAVVEGNFVFNFVNLKFCEILQTVNFIRKLVLLFSSSLFLILEFDFD